MNRQSAHQEFLPSKRTVAQLYVLGDDGAWPDQLPAASEVLLFGDSTTVSRAVLRLLENGHEGRISAVLRFGALALSDRSFGPARVGVVAIAPQDLSIGLSPLRLLRLVRGAVRRGLDWRPWVDAIHFHRATLWLRWSPRERRQAQRHLEGLWRLHVERWPEVHMDTLTDALEDGQLSVIVGRVAGLRSRDGHTEVRINTSRGEIAVRAAAILWKAAYAPVDD